MFEALSATAALARSRIRSRDTVELSRVYKTVSDSRKNMFHVYKTISKER